ncbi:unnamed protein product [Meganyctiphanes norvegica]|uniref:NACHT domain-containing protein n=1 Tax=Meganyctiphanes norvegica TaxID=48144 RepID=A0AAV2QLS4_MEGNR
MATGNTSYSEEFNDEDTSISSHTFDPVDTMPMPSAEIYTPNNTTLSTDVIDLRMKMFDFFLSPVCIPLARVYESLTKVSSQSVENYCKDVLGYSNSRYESEFTTYERKFLDDAFKPLDATMDILYKLLQRVCGLALHGDIKWITQDDTIEYHLTCIKRLRDDFINSGDICLQRTNNIINSVKMSFSVIFSKIEFITGNPIIEAKEIILNFDLLDKSMISCYIPNSKNTNNEDISVPYSSPPVSMPTSTATSTSVMSFSNVTGSQSEANKKLIMALRPIATAFAVIYKQLTKVPPGTTVEDYYKSTFGKTRYNKTFPKDLRDILSTPSWDPFKLHVNFLFILLQNVCGLASPADDKWTGQSNTLEYHLKYVKNNTNRIFNDGHLDLIDENMAEEIIISIKRSLSIAFDKTALITGNSTTSAAKKLMTDLDNILMSENTQDLNRLNLFLLMRPLSPSLKALAFIYKKMTKVSSGQTVQDYCITELNYSNKQFNSEFNKIERNLLSDPFVDPFKLDVTLLYKLLQRVCGLAKPKDSEWITTGTLEYHLKKVKDIRNELAHNSNIELDLSYAHIIINALQVSLSSALLQTEIISEVSTSNEANNLIVDLDNILAQMVLEHFYSLPASTLPVTNNTTVTTFAPVVAVATDIALTLPIFATSTAVAATAPITTTVNTSSTPTPVIPVTTNATVSTAVSATAPITTAVNTSSTPTPVIPVTNNTTASTGMTTGRMIDPQDINILKFFMAVRPTSPTATALAVIYRKLTKVATDQTVEDYCKNVLNYSNKQFNSAFNSDERNLLSDPFWDPFEQDVTFLYKLLQKVCGLANPNDSEWITPGTLEYNLKVIKGKRNYLSHEAVTVTPQELHKIFDVLKYSFESAFQSIEFITKQPATADLDKVIDNLNYILNSQACIPQTWVDCEKLLKEAREERALFVFKRSKIELKQYYLHRLKSASPITWLSNHFSQDFMIVDDIFTDLEILQTHVPVILENLLSLGRAVVIQGQPGVGKTTVVKYMAGKWPYSSENLHDSSDIISFDFSEIKNTDVLIVMQCRYILCNNITQYLKEDLLKDSLKDVAYDEVIPILNIGNIIVIVDGWDEAKPDAKRVIYEALQKLSSAQFLFTSRPEFTSDLKKNISDYSQITHIAQVKIVGFSADSRWKYVKKVFTSLKSKQKCLSLLSNKDKGDTKIKVQALVTYNTTGLSTSTSLTASHPVIGNSDEEQFLKFIEEKEDILGNMTYVPLTIALLIVVWNDDRESISSVSSTTELFVKLIDLINKNLVERLSKKSANNSYNLHRECRKWLTNELGREAWIALKQNLTCLPNTSKEKLEEFCDEKELDILEMFSTFLISDSSGLIEEYIWSFNHKSVQEFCAATYLDKLVTNENTDIVSLFFRDPYNLSRSNLYVEDSETVLYFLCGLLSSSKKMTPNIADQLIKISKVLSDGYSIVGRLILESQKNPMLLECVKDFNFTIDEIQSSDSYLTTVLLEYTCSTLNKNANIYVKKVTSQLLEVIQNYYLTLQGFSPRIRLKCTEDLTKVAQHLQRLNTYGHTECHTRLTLSTSYNTESFIGGNSCSIDNIITSRPNLANLIVSQLKVSNLPGDIINLQEYIGEVSVDKMLQAQWLLKNTQCRLHPGTGRSIGEVLELVEGLKGLIQSGEPSKTLPKHIRELWCAIDEVHNEDIPAVSWLMRHTRSRLITWSREVPMTGALVHVHQGPCGLAKLVEPHFKSSNRGVPLVFEFSSLDVLLSEGTALVKHLSDVITLQNKEELLITMEVKFSTLSNSGMYILDFNTPGGGGKE